ncbi:hypothetical protein M378DRAFT_166237 [Amanita muscaria Koide BX008]|uniref:Uncharacterized protein n=1 Tax=Amanita muscaria (strain Koide BX008) TaxID=946122 RepID=A0A0C2X081_AMAMK|nr:hypothetical protein M378DRAFT_166237 [Amanita muscaria Koide BX008]
MRFSVIYLASLLLLPSLVASKQRDPTAPTLPQSRPPSPQSPPSHPIPAHGDVVRFQGDRGPHLGVVVGTQQHQGGNVNIAPSVSNLRHSSNPLEVHINELVNTHPGNVASTSRPAQQRLASNLHWWHQVRPPTVDSAAGAVQGSPNRQAYQAAQSRGGLGHGGRRTRTRWRR